MFRNPINVIPYRSAVDITTADNEFPISFTFQGDILRHWCVEVKDINTDAVYYTSPVINTTAYNGDICGTTITVVTTGSGGIIATTEITELSWSVYLNDNPTTPTDIKTDDYTYQSNEFYFINSNIPELTNMTLTLISGGDTPITDGGTYTLDNRILHIKGDYAPNLTNTSLKYYNVTILDNNNHIVLETDNLYTSDIDFEFGGLSTGETYKVIMFLVSQTDLTNSYTYTINCSYEADGLPTKFGAEVYFDSDNMANAIRWLYTKNSVPKVTGTYTLRGNNSEVDINTGMITYDVLNGQDLNIDYNNFSFTFKITVNPLVIYRMITTSNIETLCKVTGDKTHYVNFIGEGDSFYAKYNFGSGVVKTRLYTYDFSDKFAIQDQNLQDTVSNNKYKWFDDSTHLWTNSNSDYWITNTYMNIAPVTLVITLEVNEGVVTVSATEITEE